MIKQSLVTSFFLISSVLCLGQDIDFKLQDYKLADIKFRSFNNFIGFNSRGSNEKNLSRDTVTFYDNSTQGNYSGNMLLYQNSRKRQSTLRLSASFDGYRSKYERNALDQNRDYRWNLNSNVTYENRFYIAPKYFFEMNPSVVYSFTQSNTHRFTPNLPDEYLATENTIQVAGGLPIKVGIGRLERMEDARQTLFLVKQLKKSQRLSRDLSREDMIALSSFVSQIRNKRFFDDRLQRIYQLKMIDSFYQANNYSDQTDATYYTTTMDYWMFGGAPIRNNGTRFSLAAYPFVGSYNSKIMQSSVGNYYKRITNKRTDQLFYGAEYVIDKSLSEVWQSTTNFRLYRGNRSTRTTTTFLFNDDLIQESLPGSQLHISQTIGYYPTTRTWLTVNQQFSVIGIKEFQLEEMQNIGIWRTTVSKFQTSTYQIEVDYNYYISPRFRLNVNLHYEHFRVPDPILNGRWMSFGAQVPLTYLDVSQVVTPVAGFFQFNRKVNAFTAVLRLTYSVF